MNKPASKETKHKLADLEAKAQQKEQVITACVSKKRHLIGIAKGKIHMAEDFDDPLRDFEAYS